MDGELTAEEMLAAAHAMIQDGTIAATGYTPSWAIETFRPEVRERAYRRRAEAARDYELARLAAVFTVVEGHGAINEAEEHFDSATLQAVGRLITKHADCEAALAASEARREELERKAAKAPAGHCAWALRCAELTSERDHELARLAAISTYLDGYATYDQAAEHHFSAALEQVVRLRQQVETLTAALFRIECYAAEPTATWAQEALAAASGTTGDDR